MTWKASTIVLTFCLIFVNSFYQIILSSGGYEYDEYGSDSGSNYLLSQRMLDNDHLSPFYLVYNRFLADEVFMGVDSTNTPIYQTKAYFDNTQENITEWKKYFKKSNDEEIKEIVYYLNFKGLTELEMYLKIGTPLPRNFPINNNAVKQIIKNKDFSWLNYMKFAFKCLTYIGGSNDNYNYYWSGEHSNFTLKVCNNLISIAEKELLTIKNKYLQQRFAFQICRLSHYYSVINNTKEEEEEYSKDEILIDSATSNKNFITGNPNFYTEKDTNKYIEISQKGIQTFEKYFKSSETSMVKEWSRSHYAPLLFLNGKVELAALENSKAFVSCPSKRRATKTAMYYKIEYWESLKSQNKFNSIDDELNLRGLVALDKAEKTIEDIIYIGNKNPNHFMLPVLLMRELKKVEYEFNENEYKAIYDNETYLKNSEEKKTELLNVFKNNIQFDINKLLDFCNKNKNISNKEYAFIYTLSAGYLSFKTNKFDESIAHYEAATKLASNQLQIDQVRMLAFISKIGVQKNITTVFENELLREFKWLDTCKVLKNIADNTKLTALSNLNSIYSDDQLMLHFLSVCINSPDYTSLPDLKMLELVANYLKINAHSNLQNYLAESIGITLDEIYEIKGTVALTIGEFEQAIDLFNQVKNPTIIGKTNGDPFSTNLQDCIYCNEEDASLQINKLQYAKTMSTLIKIETSGKADYNTYLKISNAFYNTTHYSANYDLLDYDRGNFGIYEKGQKMYNFVNIDSDKAEKYYLKAKDLAKSTNQKALCVYLASKCARNKDYEINNADAYNNELIPFTNRNRYFEQLATQYQNTWVHNYAKENCSYYFNYLK